MRNFGDSTAEEILCSLARVRNWVERNNYRGYEPFDGLSSWARPLAFGNQFGERLLMQLIRQCPFNLRPLMGVTPKESTKGRGYMAWGYLLLYRADQNPENLDKARACLEWLDKHKAAQFEHHSWSNHFDFVSRGGGYSKNDPIIVWTALIGHAYAEAYEVTGRDWFIERAESVCKWILALPRERTANGNCISYLADRQSSIHNSNMLGASILARTYKHNGCKDYLEAARSAMQYSCSRQRSDGSWWYGEDARYHWLDNFHTGYNLDSLKYYIDSTGNDEFVPNLLNGLRFYKSNFFEEDGCPKYYHNRKYPVDIQCAAQAIDTLATLSETDSECLDVAKRIALWTIRNLQGPRGSFYYRQYPLLKCRTPMLHWGQATMFKALARLYGKLHAAPATNEAESLQTVT